jgi:EAL domain-containing protein (putative c-di-GMP-specific phosphodiesterase class I)
VPPLAFVPTAEESGLIVGLGRWVLAEACRHVAAWQRRHPEHALLQLAVNVSARELGEPDLVEQVLGVLARSGLPAASLVLEVTESLMMADVGQAAAVLEQLRTAGVKVAIDDFGTGYSSLSYLEDLTVDYLKIDKSFVDRMTAGRGEFVVIESILHLGHALGLAVVAEGVEHDSQLEQLRAMECDYAQGYLFARPLPADELEVLLTAPTSVLHAAPVPAQRVAAGVPRSLSPGD